MLLSNNLFVFVSIYESIGTCSVYTTESCAAPGRVYAIGARLHLDLSTLARPLLHLDVSTLQRPVLLLDVSTHKSLAELHLAVSGQQKPLLLLDVSTVQSISCTMCT
jgi:hypothetical protein